MTASPSLSPSPILHAVKRGRRKALPLCIAVLCLSVLVLLSYGSRVVKLDRSIRATPERRLFVPVRVVQASATSTSERHHHEQKQKHQQPVFDPAAVARAVQAYVTIAADAPLDEGAAGNATEARAAAHERVFANAVRLTQQIRRFDGRRPVILLCGGATFAALDGPERRAHARRLGLDVRSFEASASELVSRPEFGGNVTASAFARRSKLLLWSLMEYEQVAYVHPDTVVQGSLAELFAICPSPGRTLCAPTLRVEDSRTPTPPLEEGEGGGEGERAALPVPFGGIVGGVGGAEEVGGGVGTFHPKLMVLEPSVNVSVAFSHLFGSYGIDRQGTGLQNDLDVLRVFFRGHWRALPRRFNGMQLRAGEAMEGFAAYLPFVKRVKVVMAAYGDDLKKHSEATTTINEYYCKVHGMGFEFTTERRLPLRNYTGKTKECGRAITCGRCNAAQGGGWMGAHWCARRLAHIHNARQLTLLFFDRCSQRTGKGMTSSGAS